MVDHPVDRSLFDERQYLNDPTMVEALWLTDNRRLHGIDDPGGKMSSRQVVTLQSKGKLRHLTHALSPPCVFSHGINRW